MNIKKTLRMRIWKIAVLSHVWDPADNKTRHSTQVMEVFDAYLQRENENKLFKLITSQRQMTIRVILMHVQCTLV